MKISKDKAVIEYIEKLNNTLDLNISLGEMFSSLFSNYEITDKKEIEVLASNYHKSTRDIYLDKILDYWEIDLDFEDNESFYSNYIEPCFFEIDVKEYKDNPYLKNVKVNNIKDGDYELVIDKFKPYEIFALDDITVNDEFVEMNKIAYFKEEFSFIALNYKKVTWMNITPNEINTMKKAVNLAFGDVVVYGLGLGYFQYMISLKEEVKSITIIEKDSRIIDIFTKHILPQFSHKNKMKIIKEDALKHVGSRLNYDFAFVDLWHNQDDGINLFLHFKNKEKLSPNCHFEYWLNNSFYAYLRRAFISLLIEQSLGYKDDKYQKAENNFDMIINKYYFKTKSIIINNVNDIVSMLDDNSLLNLLIN